MTIKTREQIAAGKLYVHCPRCKGDKQISICTDPGNMFRPSYWDYVNCPLCSATGEADRNIAIEYLADVDQDELSCSMI